MTCVHDIGIVLVSLFCHTWRFAYNGSIWEKIWDQEKLFIITMYKEVFTMGGFG